MKLKECGQGEGARPSHPLRSATGMCQVFCPQGSSSGSRWGRGGHGHPLGPVKISHKKMATKGDCIDFMFLGPLPYPAVGSATREGVVPGQVHPRAGTSVAARQRYGDGGGVTGCE